MSNAGSRLVIAIFGIAAIAAAGAWWYQFRQGQRILNLWGAEAAYRIRLAPQCDLWQLEPPAAADSPTRAAESSSDDAGQLEPSSVVVGDQRYRVVGRWELGDTPGFVHARQALIQDASYQWDDASTSSTTPVWHYALAFRDENGTTQLVLDLDQGFVANVATPNRLANITPIRDGLQRFFDERRSSKTDAPQEAD